MTPENAATVAHLRTLRAALAAGLREMNLASQNGTMDDWRAAQAACYPLGDAVREEEARIKAAGFGDDTAYEMAVLGHLARRHTDPCIVRWSDLAAGGVK